MVFIRNRTVPLLRHPPEIVRIVQKSLSFEGIERRSEYSLIDILAVYRT